jgi:hypothetical protein
VTADRGELGRRSGWRWNFGRNRQRLVPDPLPPAPKLPEPEPVVPEPEPVVPVPDPVVPVPDPVVPVPLPVVPVPELPVPLVSELPDVPERLLAPAFCNRRRPELPPEPVSLPMLPVVPLPVVPLPVVPLPLVPLPLAPDPLPPAPVAVP